MSEKKNFKIMFVYPNLMLQTTFPTGIALLSAKLKENGYNSCLFDTTFYQTEKVSSDEYRMEHLQLARFNMGEKFKGLPSKSKMLEDLQGMISHEKPDLIAYSFVEDVFPLTLELLEITKKFRIPTLAGGLFPTFAPEKVIKTEGIDMICIGDGENVIVDLCNCLSNKKDYYNIPGLWIKSFGEIIRNNMGAYADINTNPLPDLDMFDERRFYRPMKGKLLRQGVLETDRGCPYTCAYCNTYGQELNYKINNNTKYFRLRDIGRVHDQLKILVNKYKVEFIYMAAEVLFAMPKEHRKEFVKMYSKFKIPFFCQNRAEVINEETVHDLETMNCHSCSLGLEHGNDGFRKTMLNRRVTNDTYIRALKCFKNSKITVSVNNIIGFPDETRDLVFETVELNRKIRDYVFQINAYYFVPYHGSPLRQICLDKGYISEDEQVTHITKS